METDLREWGVTDFLPVTTLPWEVQRIRGNENEAGIKCRCLGNHDSFNYHPNALVPQLCYGTTTQGDSCKVKKKRRSLYVCNKEETDENKYSANIQIKVMPP